MFVCTEKQGTDLKLSLFTGTLPRATVWCIHAHVVKKLPPVKRRWKWSALMAAGLSTPTFQLTSAVVKLLNVLRSPQTNEKLLKDDRKLDLVKGKIWLIYIYIYIIFFPKSIWELRWQLRCKDKQRHSSAHLTASNKGK